MTRNEEKEKLRVAILTEGIITGLQKEDSGRAAEQVRKLPAYRKAKRVFVDLDASLAQVRLNVLLDGKELIAPAPGLKGGYFALKPLHIPFKDLSFAVTPRGLERHAERLVGGTLAGTPVSLFLTTALALDETGMRLGDGKGFFDLSCATIRAYQPRVRPAVFVIGSEDMVLPNALPADRWDVRATGLVTARGVRMFTPTPAALPPVIWEALDENRIRRSDFLWKLFSRRADKTGARKPERFPDADMELTESDEIETQPRGRTGAAPRRTPRRGPRRGPRQAQRQVGEQRESFETKAPQRRKMAWGAGQTENKREQGGQDAYGKTTGEGQRRRHRPKLETDGGGRRFGAPAQGGKAHDRREQSTEGQQRNKRFKPLRKAGPDGRQRDDEYSAAEDIPRGRGKTARSDAGPRSRATRTAPRKNANPQEGRFRKPRKKSGA